MNNTLTPLTIQQLEVLHRLVKHMRAPPAAPARPMCALFLTMAEQFEAVARLTKGGLVTHAAVHVRSMMEALTDIRLLAKSKTHVDVMRFKQLQGEKRTYERALAPSALLPSADRQVMEKHLEDCEERYKTAFDLISKEQRSAKTADAFTSADLPELLAPYTILCSMAHNDLAALALRHQGEHTMQMRADVPLEVSVLVHTMAHYSLMVAVEMLPRITRFTDDAFDPHHRQMKEIHLALLEACGSPPQKGRP
ncbi:MAG: DUF5677 domain-containing protein [Stenotrophomonas sp.]